MAVVMNGHTGRGDNTLGVVYPIMPNARQSGIYAIVNTVTGGFYIGSAVDLRQRQYSHLSQLRRGKHTNPHLQSSWNKHGESAFEFTHVALIDVADVRATEMRLLARLWQHPLSYNRTPLAQGIHSTAFNAERRRQWSEVQKRIGNRPSAEANRKAQEYLAAHPEIRERIAASHRGRKRPPETGRKISEMKRGKPLPAAVLAAAVAANTGRKATMEHRAKISAALKGKPKSPEQIAKQRATIALKRQLRAEVS